TARRGSGRGRTAGRRPVTCPSRARRGARRPACRSGCRPARSAGDGRHRRRACRRRTVPAGSSRPPVYRRDREGGPTMDLTTMTYEVRDGVAHVRFTRPEGANAVNPAFSADLRKVTLAVEFDDAVKAVSVTAEGKVFCAGGDLKLFHEAGDGLPGLAADMLVDFHGAICKMNSTPKPYVAGVRGAAGGAGLSLMSAFD